MPKLRVAVLMGGISGERAISLSTGRQIMAALDRTKYTPMAVDAAGPSAKVPVSAPGVPVSALLSWEPADNALPETGLASLAALVRADEASSRPDVAFIALHGRGGEDGSIQGMLELLGIPYTGSGVLASALAMDKAMTKRLLRTEGIPAPDELVVCPAGPSGEEAAAWVETGPGYPVIVKPNREGSTIGCTIVRTPQELKPAISEALRHDASALVEQFLVGTEITVGLLGNGDPMVLPIIEILAKGGFYDYEAKYAPGGSEHIIPARISETAANRARAYARRTHQLLGCRGMSRVDMIVVDDEPHVLEINTIPGMTPTSLLPDAARAAGIGFGELLDRIINSALEGGPTG